jgi:hypothetical protein
MHISVEKQKGKGYSMGKARLLSNCLLCELPIIPMYLYLEGGEALSFHRNSKIGLV